MSDTTRFPKPPAQLADLPTQSAHIRLLQRTGSDVLRERKSAIENIFGETADRPSLDQSRKAVSADRYSVNPKFAGQVEAEMDEATSSASYDEERAHVEQLRRRLSRLSTQESETELTARRKRLPSLALAHTVSRPLGQAPDNSIGSVPPNSLRNGTAKVDQPTVMTQLAEDVCAAARTFLRSPGGVQVRHRAKSLGAQPTASSETGIESSTVTIAALRELRELAVAVLKQSVAQATGKEGGQEGSGLATKIATRKRKRPTKISSVLADSTCTSSLVEMEDMEEMQVFDVILGELVPATTLSSLFYCLKKAPAISDEVWRRATTRYAQTVTVPEGVDLSPVVQELEKMVCSLHVPGKVLGLLLGSVRALYATAGKNMSADELLPLFIASVARCGNGNIAALQRFVEELGHFSPSGEVARYLTDLCAAVAHILAQDGRAVVRDWLLAHEVEPNEAEFFLAEGYSGDACVRELELLSAEQLEALVDELTGSLE